MSKRRKIINTLLIVLMLLFNIFGPKLFRERFFLDMDIKNFLLIQWFGIIQSITTIILIDFVINNGKRYKEKTKNINNRNSNQ